MKLLLLTLLLLGSQFRLVVSNDCFVTVNELHFAIAAYKQAGCNGLTDITEGCETSNVVQTYGFPMNDWCFDSILTDMSLLFGNNVDFNEDISSWDTSSVTSMDRMFWFATSFNGDLSKWNVSSVGDMGGMFSEDTSFNGDLSSWDVSSVTNMNYMFSGATAFNGDLSSWDTSSVVYMEYMFYGATSFNQNLCAWSENYQAWNIVSTGYAGNYEMFTDSGCSFQEDPKREEGGPFCKSDCSPTASPSTNPTASSPPTASPIINPTASSSSVQYLMVCSTVVVLVSVAVQLM